MTHTSVTIQITPESEPATPAWMGEVAAFAQVLAHTGMLESIQEQVRFARARFGQYDQIDFVAVLIGYALSEEATLLAFYQRLAPFAEPFMALFGRSRLPHRSTLSRFLAALDQSPVEALRTLFQKDLLARKPFASPGGVFDQTECSRMIVLQAHTLSFSGHLGDQATANLSGIWYSRQRKMTASSLCQMDVLNASPALSPHLSLSFWPRNPSAMSLSSTRPTIVKQEPARGEGNTRCHQMTR